MTSKVNLYFSGDEVFVWTYEEAILLRKTHRVIGKPVGTFADRRHTDERLMTGLPVVLMPEEVLVLLDAGLANVYGWPEDRPTLKLEDFDVDSDVEASEPLAKRPRADNSGEPIVQEYIEPGHSLPLADLAAFRAHYEAHVFPRGDATLAARATVFGEMWRKGYFMSSGLKFGGDYLVYQDDPFLVHAYRIVTVRPPDAPLDLIDIVSWGRLAVSVKKSTVFASCELDPSSRYGVSSPQYLTIDWRGV